MKPATVFDVGIVCLIIVAILLFTAITLSNQIGRTKTEIIQHQCSQEVTK